MLFDTHTHYDDPRYDADRDEIIRNAHARGVGLMLNASSELKSGIEGIRIAREYPFMVAAIGVHPHYAGSYSPDAEKEIRRRARDPKVVAVGETGLDYYYENSPKQAQKDCFASQIALARELKLPLVIHSREAARDTLDILRSENAQEAGGVLHCYGGSVETAALLLKMGFYFSFGGVLTFKNARQAKEVAAWLPLDRILVETDCPYLSPEPYRGQRNDSSLLIHVVKALAAIRGITVEEAEEATCRNGLELFQIRDHEGTAGR
ncbi:MAG TPA: hydrolase TatD [Clostridiales bacterium]|nr:hydrolase TatD [Clostridiales bacterium]